MDLQLKEKVIIVTGSSRGIGLGIAQAYSKEGAKVVLNGRNEEDLKNASSQLAGENIYVVSDVTKTEDSKLLIDETIKNFGKVDVLVCNVGSGSSVPPGQETAAEWKKVFDVNFSSATNVIEFALPHLEAAQGNIVCISSICGSAALGAPVTYSSAKAAMNSMVKGLSRPLGAKGVRINAIAPGNILFDGSVWDKFLKENEAGVNEMLEKEVPLKRLGTPEDIANWAVFLGSEKSSFATGELYVVDGGQLKS